jgi:hypothetical protein
MADASLPAPGQTVRIQGKTFLICRVNTDLDAYYNDEPARLTLTYHLIEAGDAVDEGDLL